MPDSRKSVARRRHTKSLLRPYKTAPTGGRAERFTAKLPVIDVTGEIDTALRAASAGLGVPRAQIVREALADWLGVPAEPITPNKEN